MQDTRTPSHLQARGSAGSAESARLSWLLAENELESERRRLFRTGQEEEEMLLMTHPVSTQQAFARFGMLLGIFPPAAIFYRLFGRDLSQSAPSLEMILLLLAMNLICCFAGRYFGAKLSRMVAAVERDGWSLMFIEAVIIGFLWGLCTGAVGGFLLYGFGAIAGAICAVPVGALAFALFIPLHRLFARGGMIDARDFWPLACCVVLSITALILGL
jgi:hypothetical protein